MTALARLRFAPVALIALGACSSEPDIGLLITSTTIVDGTGAAARTGSVRVRGDRIAEIGDLDPAPGESVIDGAGLILAPGFIDSHSHHDGGLTDQRDALAAVSQGITTIVVGQDGGSHLPLEVFFGRLEENPAAINVASYAGHNTIRRQVMGADFQRPATATEIDSMRAVLERELEAGALGLSTGLEYDPGIYAATEEVVALARVAAAHGGRYISHMRSEDRAVWDAVEEIIRIGRDAGIPVQISHMKLAMVSLWGQAGQLLARLDQARADGIDITADVYPYEFWQSTMTVLFPERDFADREAAAFALEELVAPDRMIIARFEPDTSYVGATLAQIARRRATDPVTTYLQLIAEAQAWEDSTGRGAESVIARSMAPADIATFLAWEHTNVCTDGALAGRHPRGYGSFTRILGRYVRNEGLLTLEEAVHKMTQLAARHVGVADRGTIEVGRYADLILFDPETVLDQATSEDPQRPSRGVRQVLVNGVAVYTKGLVTPSRPGRVVRRPTGD